MKAVGLGNLPPGARVRGQLYADPGHEYLAGDVLEVELSTGVTVDVGWDEGDPAGPFRVAAYREYFGDRFVDFRARDVVDVVVKVGQLVRLLSVRNGGNPARPADGDR